MTSGGTSFQSNALGVGRETAAGASTSYIRDGSGFLLEQRLPSGDFYYLSDGLGSVVALTDTAGTVATTYKYEPFGKPASTTGSVTNPWRDLGCLGVYFEAGTGLYKMGTRYYDPALGRFTQTDPVAGGSATAYDYANQDPINQVDPAGTFSVTPGGSCVAAGSYHTRPRAKRAFFGLAYAIGIASCRRSVPVRLTISLQVKTPWGWQTIGHATAVGLGRVAVVIPDRLCPAKSKVRLRFTLSEFGQPRRHGTGLPTTLTC